MFLLCFEILFLMLFLYSICCIISDLTTALINMPPYNKVRSLQSLALDQSCKTILDVTAEINKDVYKSRDYFINNLHAWARTNILTYTKTL